MNEFDVLHTFGVQIDFGKSAICVSRRVSIISVLYSTMFINVKVCFRFLMNYQCANSFSNGKCQLPSQVEAVAGDVCLKSKHACIEHRKYNNEQ